VSAADPSLVLSLPGKLYLGVTTAGMAAGAAPYGGKELGIKRAVHVWKEERVAFRDSEAHGRDKIGAYRGGVAVGIAIIMVQYDPDVEGLVWASSTTSPNGYVGANILTASRAGQTSLAPGIVVASGPLLHAADDPENESCLLAYPLWCSTPKLELERSIDKTRESALVVYAGMDPTTGVDIRMAKLQDLSLVA